MKIKFQTTKLMFFFSLIMFLIITINVFFISVIKVHPRSGRDIKKYVEDGNTIERVRRARRGNILDINNNVIAQDVDSYDVICVLDKNRITNDEDADKAYVKDPAKTAKALSEILGGSEAYYFSLLSNKDVFQTELGVSGKNISRETKEKIEALNLPGVEFRRTNDRNYPLKNFAPYVVGYTHLNDKGEIEGAMGIESIYNDYLKGEDGYEAYESSEGGFILSGMKKNIIPEKNGHDIQLTLDWRIQNALNESIQEAVNIYKPIDVWAAVAEIHSGRILAWGQYPTFDQKKLDIKEFINKGTQYTYEPGSTFKTIIYSSAMDLGVYNGSSTFDSGLYCYTSDSKGNPKRTYSGNGYDCVANFNYIDWGNITFDDGFIRSSNVATSTLLSDFVGPTRFYEYVDKFGFFKPVDTDGFIEEVGSHNYEWASEKLNMSFGQGISTNMLHILQAHTAIFGNGEMVKPYFVEKIINPNTKEVVYQHEREVVAKPISAKTAKQMQDLMLRVTTDENGSRHYGVDGVKVMAKTGTSQVSSPKGGYDPDVEIISVIMGFPYDNPKYMLYFATKADMPDYAHYKNTPPRTLLSKISKILNFNSNFGEITDSKTKLSKFQMPNLINKSVDEVKTQLKDYKDNVIIIGEGKTVLNQIPQADKTVLSNEKIFILTSKEGIKMPDMTNWTRKEVTSFWSITDTKFILNGLGIVKKQSVKAGEIIKPENTVEVYFEDIKKQNKETPKKTTNNT